MPLYKGLTISQNNSQFCCKSTEQSIPKLLKWGHSLRAHMTLADVFARKHVQEVQAWAFLAKSKQSGGDCSNSRGTYSGGMIEAWGWWGGGGTFTKIFIKSKKFLSEMSIIFSDVKNSKNMEEVHKKGTWHKFRLYEVNFDLTCEGHPNYSRAYFMNIMSYFNDHQMCPNNWLHYFWVSLCQVPFFMNLLHSPRCFDIWQIIGKTSPQQSTWWKFHYLKFVFLFKIGDLFWNSISLTPIF